jgi:hypothetical protein
MPGGFVVVADPPAVGGVQHQAAVAPQYVMVVDGRPDPIVVIQQASPGTQGVVLTQGRRGAQGDPGLSAYELALQHGFTGTLQQYLQMQRGFILIDPDADNPPTGTYDSTWVFQELEGG